MIGNVLALVALVLFGSVNTTKADSIDATTSAAAPVAAVQEPAAVPAQLEEVNATLEEVKATNAVDEDDDNFGSDEDEKISSRSFNLEEEDGSDEEDFD